MSDVLDWLSDQLHTQSRTARRQWVRLFPAEAGELREWIALIELLEWFFGRLPKANPAFRAQLRAELMRIEDDALHALEVEEAPTVSGGAWRKWGVGSAAVVVAGAIVWWRRSQSDAA